MEFMPNFHLHRPKAIEEAVKLMAESGAASYLAGGTDLVVNIRRGIVAPEHLIDLTDIDGLDAISEDGDGLHLGAAVTLSELGADKTAGKKYAAVAEAARAIAGSTHQHYGTVGGNLCLDTRCIFYNQSEWWRGANDYCLKNRGDTCHVAPGGEQCFAAFSGDLAPALMVFGAEIDLLGPDGARRIKLADLYKNDGRDHLALKPGELLREVHLPKSTAGAPSAYEKVRVRGSIDFPLAGAAVRLETTKGGKVKSLTIALTGVNPYPQLIDGCDEFTGKALDEEALDALRDRVRGQAKPMRTTTVAPWYRRRVAGALARRLTAGLAAS
jgi:4-hydroxybenzoyl-CoA reductase subunit beta